MRAFVIHRVLLALLVLWISSAISFLIIKMQPGDFLTQYLDDPRISPETVERVRVQLGLDQPLYLQYGRWLWGIVSRGDFGYSFVTNRPVVSMIWERMGWTVAVAGATFVFSWCVAIPLGILAAVRRSTGAELAVKGVTYLAHAVPDFLAALLLVWLALQMGMTSVGGLFSPRYIDAPWSLAKLRDMLAHLWIPLIAIGFHGVAGLMRLTRANILDVLGADFVRTARAKGLGERTVLYRHVLRNAINPLISLAGLSLPYLINGTIISSIVLNLPTIGPMLYDALVNKDQYLAMTLLLFSSLMLIVGNLLADIALAWADPRVRYD